MSKHTPEKNYGFFKDFLLGEKIAEQRIKLARKYDYKDFTGKEIDIKEYILLRKKWGKIRISGPKSGLMNVLGYAHGTYTTFCPFQSQLDNFDKAIDELTKPAREGLSS